MQLAGELAKISLASLIQLLRNGELTGKVCLTQGANTAFIFVNNGRIVHVEKDGEQGKAALLELFLWLTGTFSFVEADVASMQQTLPQDEPIEKIIREGLVYLEKKKHLDQLRISARTVLKPATARVIEDPIYEVLDGSTSLGDISTSLGLRRFDYINSVYDLLVKGHAVVVDQPAQSDEVHLPAWVVSRLKQDNPDVTQAIVQMVIWVDRVKCWMYQADADMDRIISDLQGTTPPEPPTDATPSDTATPNPAAGNRGAEV